MDDEPLRAADLIRQSQLARADARNAVARAEAGIAAVEAILSRITSSAQARAEARRAQEAGRVAEMLLGSGPKRQTWP